MDFLQEYGLFLAQTVTFVAAVLILVAGLIALGQKQKTEQHEGHVEIRKLNDKYRHIGDTIRQAVSDPDVVKRENKARKKADKAQAKEARKKRKHAGEGADELHRPRLYVLNFHGDLKAGATDNLREEVSAVLLQAEKGDEVLVRVESPGGLVHGYGLAASQLQRLRDAEVPLTIAVDKVAASGGYMMACVANHIISAPFAVVGSIGVMAQLPNFHRLLQKHEIDFELLTAGEYKRTLSLFGENTEKGRQKFMEELEDTHQLFKAFVSANRPALDIARVATGEVWYGQNALDVGLVDEIRTSDSFIQERLEGWDVFDIRFVYKKSWQERLGVAIEGAMERAVMKIWQRGQERKPY